jgi:hypothetical protein
LAAAVLLSLAPQALAFDADGPPTPEQVARRSIHRLNAIGDRTVDAIRDITHESVPRIVRLVAAGQPREAEMLARRSTHRIRSITEESLDTIGALTRRAHRILHRLGARPALHEAVNDAARENAGRIRHAAARSIHAIRDALNP